MGENALYLGFKMYTAQGYRPWDVRRLPTMKEFYGKCCLNGIPIMNHCTPGGAKTQEADDYYNLEHPFDDMNEENEERKGCSPSDYFSKHFVSPEAWKKVLDSGVELEEEKYCIQLNKLRLCLAHFGGPKALDWSQQIIDMVMQKDKYVPKLFAYPNLYSDISSSFASGKFRDYFKELYTGKLSEEQKKRIRSRILFGTDWFMTLQYGAFNKKNLWDYIAITKDWLDSFDTSLWPYFTQYNPYRFYRLDTEINRIKDSIINILEDVGVLEVQKPIETSAIENMNKNAAWVKAANAPHVIFEETP
jgi:predicted TIM-barrel fold metal-dependent hydrolase